MYAMDSSSISLLGFGAVVIVGAVVMYLVSLFSMKETRFEDVMEEQRRKKAKEDKERSLHNKQKREQYKRKFVDQKKKKAVGNGKVDKVEASREDQTKDSADNVQVTPAAEAKKQPKAKSAKKQEPPAQQQAQQKHDSPKPSHPILKHTTGEKPHKEEAKPVKTATEAKAEMQDAGRGRTVSFSDDVQDKQKNDAEQEKSKKKRKKEVEVESEVVGQLKETSLSDRDVQSILTMVKQKYGIDVGGGAKIRELQQQLDSAQKQLNQQETNLKNYVSRCMGAEGKIEQLKQDILVEKTKVTSLEKAVEDAETKRQTEVSSLKSQHAAEMKQIQEKIAIAKDYEELCKNVANLKTENRLLRGEVEKNAAAMSEKQRLSADLSSAKTQLQEAQKKCSELEQQIKNAGETSENAKQQQSDSAKLLDQVTSLNDDLEAKTAGQKALEKRLEESKKVIAERDSKVKNLNKQTSDLTARVKNLEQQVSQLKTEAVKIEQETKRKSAAEAKAEAKAASDEQVDELQSSLENVKKEKSALQTEVDRLKKKNNDLRERSWNVMDNLSRLQKELPEKVSTAKAEGETRCANLQSFIKQSLSSAFPAISAEEENFEAWVAEFTKQAAESSQTVQSTQDSSPELEEARNQVQNLHDKLAKSSKDATELKTKVENLEATVENVQKENANFKGCASQHKSELSNATSECEKYKSVLKTTEEVLRKLQSSVEVEEGVWRKKVTEAQSEASKAKADTDSLQKAIKSLESEKSSLENDLKESQELKKQLEEMTKEVSELKDQLETAKAAVTDSLQETSEIELNNGEEGSDQEQRCDSSDNNIVSDHSESPVQVHYSGTDADNVMVVEQHPDAEEFLVIDQLDMEEERLEKEKTMTKNLGQAATKLQSALKQSQQQLMEEKDKNAELEQKLANGNGDQIISNEAVSKQQPSDPATGDGTSV